jgi:hypothetical protein
VDWHLLIDEVASHQSKRQVLDGRSVTSREPEGDVSIELDVVAGDVVARALPWLYQLYSTHLLELASDIAGQKLFPANDITSAININRITGIGGRYEWHVDSNPVTGVLFASTLHPGDGGELHFASEHFQRLIVPQRGLFFAFDARDIPHRVEPLLRDVCRLSVPMNFYISADNQPRPGDLDTYLYRESHK